MKKKDESEEKKRKTEIEYTHGMRHHYFYCLLWEQHCRPQANNAKMPNVVRMFMQSVCGCELVASDSARS